MRWLLLSIFLPCVALGVPRDLVHPLGDATISSGFGMRLHPISSNHRHHDGIDLPCPEGTPVRALSQGTVIQVATGSGYGLYVTVFHGGAWATVYAHLSAAFVNVGDEIFAGDILGRVGQTGNVTGPHLHFELRRDGVALDPLSYLPFLLDDPRG